MQIRVKPAPERRVLNHQNNFQPIPDEGCLVERDGQILRRLADGDLVEVIEEPAKPSAKTKS